VILLWSKLTLCVWRVGLGRSGRWKRCCTSWTWQRWRPVEEKRSSFSTFL
jgi:hypothetical protein